MPFARHPVPRPRRHRGAGPAAAAAVAVATLAMPVAPAGAAAPGSLASVSAAVPAAFARPGGAACTLGRFTASAQADVARIAVLDPGPLAPGLPALADVRLAPAYGRVDTGNRAGKSAARASYADAKLLGMKLPGLPLDNAVADHQAPGRRPGPVSVELAALNTGGLAAAQAGKATAEATWDDRYHCGRVGPLTRASTMLEGLSLLSSSKSVLSGRGSSSYGGGPASGGGKTTLLKVGPTGSAQSATDLVTLGRGRIGVRSGAGVALGDLTLFGGTPQEITVKVINQPTLEVVAGGDRAHSAMTYRPATLAVTSAGKPLTGLDSEHSSVSVKLLGPLTAERPASLLSVRLSLGEPTEEITADAAKAEAAALRVEVKLGPTHLLDVALGYLSVAATAPCSVTSPSDGYQRTPDQPSDAESPADDEPATDEPATDEPDTDQPGTDQPPTDEPGSDQPVDAADTPAPPSTNGTSGPLAAPGHPGSDTPSAGGLALTGANVAAVGIGGVTMIAVGLVAMVLTRRRRS
ncbi:hypothetical protein [Actinoplanes palleronii]|nr:hypothetical protein [Actinoplanes palleronii]